MYYYTRGKLSTASSNFNSALLLLSFETLRAKVCQSFMVVRISCFQDLQSCQVLLLLLPHSKTLAMLQKQAQKFVNTCCLAPAADRAKLLHKNFPATARDDDARHCDDGRAIIESCNSNSAIAIMSLLQNWMNGNNTQEQEEVDHELFGLVDMSSR